MSDSIKIHNFSGNSSFESIKIHHWIFESNVVFPMHRYAAPLYVDIKRTIKPAEVDPVEHQHQKIFLGKIPTMVRSSYCILNGLADRDLTELNECPLDPGGYFIINGSEKVLIAQEKLASNTGEMSVCIQP